MYLDEAEGNVFVLLNEVLSDVLHTTHTHIRHAGLGLNFSIHSDTYDTQQSSAAYEIILQGTYTDSHIQMQKMTTTESHLQCEGLSVALLQILITDEPLGHRAHTLSTIKHSSDDGGVQRKDRAR